MSAEITRRAATLVHQRQKIVMLNDPAYDYIELASGGLGHSSLTLIREGPTLYCIYDWPTARLGSAMSPGEIAFNAELLAEYQKVGSQYQVTISEYILSCQMEDNLPTTTVYCGWGWGGSLASMMATIVPPDYCYEFASKAEAFSVPALLYLYEKCPADKTEVNTFPDTKSKREFAELLGAME